MSNTLLFSPRIKALDISGNPISGANLYIYNANTSKKAYAYKGADLSVAHSNPIKSNNFGDFPAIYCGTGVYKFVLTDAEDNVIWTEDNIDLYDENAYLTTQDEEGNIVISNSILNKKISFKITNTDYPNGVEVVNISGEGKLSYNSELNIEESITGDDDIPNNLYVKNKVKEATPYDYQSGFNMTINLDSVNIEIGPGNGTIENSTAGSFLTNLTVNKDISLPWSPEIQSSVCCPISGPYDESLNPYYVSFAETSELVEGETVYHTAVTIRASTKFSFPNGLIETNLNNVLYTLESDYSPVSFQDVADGYYNIWITYDSDTSTFTGYISDTDPIYLANTPPAFEDDTFYYISSINKTFIGSTETKAMYLGWFTIENGRMIRNRFTNYGERESICAKITTKRAYTTTGTNSYTAPTNFKYATVIAIGGGGSGWRKWINNSDYTYYITAGGGGGAICRDILYDISTTTFTVGGSKSASTFGNMTASGGGSGSTNSTTIGIGGIAYNTRSFTNNYVGVNGIDGSVGLLTYSSTASAGAGGKADYATLAATLGVDELSGYGTGLGGAAVNYNTGSNNGKIYGGAHSGYCTKKTKIVSSTHPNVELLGAQGLVLIIEVA